MTRVYSADWLLPVEGEPIEEGGLAVDAGRIVEVGPADDLEGERLHYEHAVIIPGLVNAHTHLEYAAYAGFGDGLSFAPWISLHIARKRRLDWDGHLAIARLGAAECLASGVTTVADSSFAGAAAAACAELGLRGTVYLEVFGGDPAETRAQLDEKLERVGDVFTDVLRPGISPHAPYTVSNEAYADAYETGLPVATHLHESSGEREWMTEGRGEFTTNAELLVPPAGETGIRRLADAGVLRPGLLAAHCVHVDAEEIALLAENGVSVAHCPRSNALLGCGIAPVAGLLAAGVTVGVGTDSPASAPSFDLFDELRAAVLCARAREQRPDALAAREAIALATLGGARALGLDAEVGSLVTGKRADFAVVSLAGSAFLPWEDPAAAVVLGGSAERVMLTVVQGEERYRKGGEEWLELLPGLRRSAAAARGQMLAEAAPLASKI